MQNRQTKEENKPKKPRVNQHLLHQIFYSIRIFQAKKEPGTTTKKETAKKETKTTKRPKPLDVSTKGKKRILRSQWIPQGEKTDLRIRFFPLSNHQLIHEKNTKFYCFYFSQDTDDDEIAFIPTSPNASKKVNEILLISQKFYNYFRLVHNVMVLLKRVIIYQMMKISIKCSFFFLIQLCQIFRNLLSLLCSYFLYVFMYNSILFFDIIVMKNETKICLL